MPEHNDGEVKVTLSFLPFLPSCLLTKTQRFSSSQENWYIAIVDFQICYFKKKNESVGIEY